MGYLQARLNEGLALLHCVHDDGDTEDLEEHEAETAVEDFKHDFVKVSDSRKNEARRKQQRQRQLDKAAAAAQSLRELGKKMPVECIGYQVQRPAQTASHSAASSSSASESASVPAPAPASAELVVLKRFRDSHEAALALQSCWESQGAEDDDNAAAAAANGAAAGASGGAGKSAGGLLTTVLGRSRVAEMKKGILRCCQGLDQGCASAQRAGKGQGRSSKSKGAACASSS